MINLEFVFRLVDVVRGTVNTAMYLIGLGEKPQKNEEKEASQTQQTLKSLNFFVELYLSMRAAALLLAEMAHVLSQPSMTALAVIALAPPPLLIALYAVAAVYQGYKIAKEVSVLFRKDVSAQDRQKARMEIAHAAVVLTACLAIIASNFIMPGATNILAFSCILAGGALKGLQYSLKYLSKKETTAPVDTLKTANSAINGPEHQLVMRDAITIKNTERPETLQAQGLLAPKTTSSKLENMEAEFFAAESKLTAAQSNSVLKLEAKGEKTQIIEPIVERPHGDLEHGALHHAEHQKADHKHTLVASEHRSQ